MSKLQPCMWTGSPVAAAKKKGGGRNCARKGLGLARGGTVGWAVQHHVCWKGELCFAERASRERGGCLCPPAWPFPPCALPKSVGSQATIWQLGVSEAQHQHHHLLQLQPPPPPRRCKLTITSFYSHADHRHPIHAFLARTHSHPSAPLRSFNAIASEKKRAVIRCAVHCQPTFQTLSCAGYCSIKRARLHRTPTRLHLALSSKAKQGKAKQSSARPHASMPHQRIGAQSPNAALYRRQSPR
ncbi:hypothetical protein L1887_51885 [Cichorium endivia]|nr:hypothetical protein L1887_51885 [Cichorium endivia]